MASKKTAAAETRIDFEDAMKRLETIVEELEGGQLSLEDSIARYEEGVTLSRQLTGTLDKAEKRIERLAEPESAGAADDDADEDAGDDGDETDGGAGSPTLPF